jgi:hypothetical protein
MLFIEIQVRLERPGLAYIGPDIQQHGSLLIVFMRRCGDTGGCLLI